MKFKLLLLFILTISCLLLTTSSVHAQVDQNNTYNNTNPDVPHNLHTYTQSIFIEIASTLSCQLSGVDPANPTAKCLGIDPKTKRIGYVEGGGGAIGLTGNFIAATFYIPVSTHDYVSNLASNFGFAKKTYAQEGVGFNGLRPTLQLWQAFRNITYMFFVILFVVMGLGIMFRVKIDPRTVMTIQNQIPKVIVGLVLVTFSYAIAGFLIDLMYVLLYLIISVFAQQGFNPVDISANNPWGAIGGLGGISGIANGTALSISGIVRSMFDGTIGNIVGGAIGAIIGKLLSGNTPIGWAITGVGALIGATGGSWVVEKTAWVISYLVIMIAIFSALLRLWFVLIKAYIYLLISVVFAPFYITYGILPGTSGFGSWIKSMVANLSVFPVTVIMILLGKAFVDGFSKGDAVNPPFVPPMVAGFTPDRLGPIIGLAIILMLPEVANMIRDTLKSPAFKYDASIGKSLGVGTGVISGGPRNAWQGLMREPKWPGQPGGPLRERLGALTERNKAAGVILGGLGFHYTPPKTT